MATTANGRCFAAAAISLLALGLLGAPANAARVPGRDRLTSRTGSTAAGGDAVVCLVNAERTSRGLPPLARDADLAQAARGHAPTWRSASTSRT